MSDLLRAIDNIRSYLDAGASVASERLRENAKLYADACQRVNDRLSECAGLLGQGLRSEALHQAQLDPPLLDQLSTLDFPGSDRWAGIASSCGVPTPLLQLRMAQQLNAAYAEDRPLVELMKQHRRLALCKGELVERVRVLRKIADIDRANLYWEDDLRALEKGRLAELKEAFDRAKREQDFDQIHAIHDEALSLEWREIPEEAFVRAVEKALEKVKDHELREQFEQWDAAMSQFMNDRNFAQARTARTQIQTLIQKNRVSMQDPILRGIPRMLDWLSQEEARQEREREFEAALRKLQQTLNVPEPDLPTVQEAWRAATNLGYPIPRRVEEDYLACEYRDAERKRRKRIVTIGGLVVVLILTGLGIFFWVDQARKRSKLNDAVVQFTLLVRDANFKLARESYNENEGKFDTGFTNDKDVSTAYLALKKFEEEEGKKKAEAMKRIEEAKSIPFTDRHFEDTINLVLDSPYLDPKDKQLLLDRLEEYKRRTKASRADADKTFGETLKKIEDKQLLFLDTLKDSKKQAESRQLLDEIVAGCKSLGDQENDLATDSLRDRYSRLKSQVESNRKALDAAVRDRAFTDAFDRVFENRSFSPAELVALLKSESRAAPGSQRAKDFDLVVEEREAWEAQISWNEFLAKAGDLSSEAGATTMVGRVGAMETFMKFSRTFVASKQEILPRKEILAYEKYLQGYSVRVKAAADYQQMLNRRDCRNLFAQKLKSDLYYYFLTDPGPEIARLRGTGREKIQLAPVLNKSDLQDGATPKTIFVNLSDLSEEKAMAAPQVLLVGSVQTKLKAIQPASWDKTMVEVLTTIAEAREVDSILRADLVYRLLDQIEKGNPILVEQLSAAREAVKKVDRDFKWLDPTEKDTANERTKAVAALKLIPPASKLLDLLGKSRDATTSVLKEAAHPPQGWLYREANDTFRCRTPNKALDDGYLYVMAAEANAPAHWVRVATVSGGRINALVAPDARAEGRPLFWSKNLISIK